MALYAGWPFYAGAWQALRLRAPGDAKQWHKLVEAISSVLQSREKPKLAALKKSDLDRWNRRLESMAETARQLFLLQVVQPGLVGLMDGSVSTLAPLFAAAFATRAAVTAGSLSEAQATWSTSLVGLAASVGAGISMGFAEALSDDGSMTGRGRPFLRRDAASAPPTWISSTPRPSRSTRSRRSARARRPPCGSPARRPSGP